MKLAISCGGGHTKPTIGGSGDDHAILSECERGEDSAVKEYEKALNDDLSPSLREIVSSQYSEVKNAHDRVRTLRDAIK